MYFDFEDYHPDISPVGRAISWREGVLLSIIAHLVFVILLLLAPRWFPDLFTIHPRPVSVVAANTPPEDAPRFVFVQPRVDTKAPKAPDRAAPSDQDRQARAPERAKEPTNPLPFSRGNTPERVEQVQPEPPRGQGPLPDPAAGQPQAPAVADNTLQLPDAGAQPTPPPQAKPSPGLNARGPLGGGGLGQTMQNLQKYVQKDQFQNSGGSGGAFGPAIQFDTKGVEFGPWIRRFIAQVKRNWDPLIPLAAMTNRGHVVVTFNVHKNGSITDLTVIGPSPFPAFNTAAFGALVSSNPTAALPPEYPSEQAFFTVTFFYNEDPPQ